MPVIAIAARPYQISLQLADGRTVTSGRPRGDSEPTGPILAPLGGGGTSHYQHSQWWAWPLPPSGPLQFIILLANAHLQQREPDQACASGDQA